MDALDLLRADHNRLRGLSARFGAAHEAGDLALMGALAGRIGEEIEMHTAIEEEHFYPAVRRADRRIAEALDASLQEHHVVKLLLGEIRDLQPGELMWAAKLSVLIDSVQHHMAEEERELFPEARQALDRAARLRLASALERRKAALGAPVGSDREGLSCEQVHELARVQQIPGRSKMTSAELRATIDPRG